MLVEEPKLKYKPGVTSPKPGIYISKSPQQFLDYKVWKDAEDMPSQIWDYGVCDSYQQLLEKCPIIESSDREYIVTFFQVDRSDQEEEGGWRWHKWGDYIGDQEITMEYIYDEPEIERVYCYQIYEKV